MESERRTGPAGGVDRIEAADYRACLGEFATGVTVVIAGAGGEAAGMTLNAFTSVSLDPPLILVSMAHKARTLDAIKRDRHFAVSVLQRSQRELAIRFARQRAAFPTDLVELRGDDLVVPNALGYLGAELVEVVPAGDHDLVIGRVSWYERKRGQPLVFHRGRLGGLAIDYLAPAPGGWDFTAPFDD